ncbi:hypothetical protein CBR_g2936 [Chara braunii]|uniref:Uncharacterized protein n=1 Tax=Chara braunii TaxID=69332 RepID=A0A388KEL3_CHABU|nr:hypothetical protein CBR_g2936 [Chara braunii]|eukprot:GBG68393.1 hypothetical protein CBR_g2936 [Chara braunii]
MTKMAHSRQVRSYEARNGNAGPRPQYKLGDILQVRKCARQGKLAPRFFGRFRVVELCPSGVNTVWLALEVSGSRSARPIIRHGVLPSSSSLFPFSSFVCIVPRPRRGRRLSRILLSLSTIVFDPASMAMSFSTEQVISERLMVPGGTFSAIRQVWHPRLSPDLLRFVAFFSTTAIHAAAEFLFRQSGVARVLAEVSAFLRLSPPCESHVSVIVVFTGNLTTLHPARHTAVLRQLRDWWWQAYAALSFCLLEVTFHWAAPTDRSAEDEIPDDEVELLLIQGGGMDTEGDFLGIVFEEVRDDHLSSITNEMLVFLTQVLDDLSLEILSHCDERPGTATLARTLEPHLLWSTCTELEGNGYDLPPRGAYLIVDVTDLSTWDPLIRRIPIGETSEETEEEEGSEGGGHLQSTEGETTPEKEESGDESDDPDY